MVRFARNHCSRARTLSISVARSRSAASTSCSGRTFAPCAQPFRVTKAIREHSARKRRDESSMLLLCNFLQMQVLGKRSGLAEKYVPVQSKRQGGEDLKKEHECYYLSLRVLCGLRLRRRAPRVPST